MKPTDAKRVATSETTPLVVGNTMYLGSPYGKIVALDATTGKELWVYHLPGNTRPASRGIACWPGEGVTRPSFCLAPITARWWRSM